MSGERFQAIGPLVTLSDSEMLVNSFIRIPLIQTVQTVIRCRVVHHGTLSLNCFPLPLKVRRATFNMS